MSDGRDDRIELVAERADFLEAMADPTDKRTLVDRLDASRSTVDRAVGALEDAGLVERDGGRWRATPVGRLAVRRYRAYLSDSGDVMRADAVLDPLPADTDIEVDLVAGADVYRADDPTPYRPVERVHEAVETAEEYRAVLPSLDDPRHLRLLYERVVTHGASADLVVSEDLFATLRERFPRRMAAMADTDRVTVRVGEVPAYALVLTDQGERPRFLPSDELAHVLTFADSGTVHGSLRNDSERALRWGRDRFAAVRETAEDVTERFRQPAADGVVADAEGPDPLVTPDLGPATGLPFSLERSGFVRLSPTYFADRRVADPTTAWRAGLDLAEVHTGYAVERTVGGNDADGRDGTGAGVDERLADRLHGRLLDGQDCLVVGPPGSGKSTTLKRVACRWYDEDRGPVLYRAGGRGHHVDSPTDLVDAVTETEGHALVVVEDAVRPDAVAVFEVLPDLADRDDVSVLLDAREAEWRDPPEAVDPAVVDDLDVVSMPPLGDRDVERVVAHFERTAGATVDAPVERLREEVREEAADEATPGEVLLLLHRLATYADPLADDATSLEADVSAALEEFADAGETTLAVATLATLCSAAGIDLRPGYLHALAGPNEHGDVAAAVETLSGRVLFDRRPEGYRTVHEAWAAAFLAALADREDATDLACEAVFALLSLADDPDRRDRIERELGAGALPDRVGTAPEEWADDVLEELIAVARDRPRLAALFDDGSGIDLPEACSPDRAHDLADWLGHAHLDARTLDAARRAFERLPEDGGEREIQRLEGLAGVMEHRNEYDGAIALLEEALELARDEDDLTEVGRTRFVIGRIARERGEYDRAREHAEDALEIGRETDDRRLVGRCHNLLGKVAGDIGDYGTARDHAERSLEIDRDLGDLGSEAASLINLGRVAALSGDLEAAREHWERALDLLEGLGYPARRSSALMNLGVAAKQQGDYDAAEAYLERALETDRTIDDPHSEASTLENLATVESDRGDYRAAREHHEQALEIRRDVGDRDGEAGSLANLGALANDRGNLDRASQYFSKSLELRREIGDRRGEALTLNNLGVVAKRRGEYDRAQDHLETALDIRRDIGDTIGQAVTLKALGDLALLEGDSDRAVDLLEEAIDRADEAGVRSQSATARSQLAVVHRVRGDLEAAADRHREALEAGRETDELDPEADALVQFAWTDLYRGNVGDAADRASECLAVDDSVAVAARGEALLVEGTVALRAGDLETAADRFEEASSLAEDEDDPRIAGRAMVRSGALERRRGEYGAAAETLSEALEALEDAGSRTDAAGARLERARLARDRSDRGPATDRNGGDQDRDGDGSAHDGDGWDSDLQTARDLAERALATARELGATLDAVDALVVLAGVERLAGAFDSADERLAEADDALDGTGYETGALRVELERGRLALDRGDHEAATDHLSTAADGLAGGGFVLAALDALDALVDARVALGEREAALESLDRAVDLADEAGLADRREAFDGRRDALLERTDAT